MVYLGKFLRNRRNVIFRVSAAAIALLMSAGNAFPDFWTVKGKGQLETVTLSRDLPPVASRKGNTVQFLAEVAGNSITPDILLVLRSKIQTLLMNTKGGAIQLVDSSPDTVIKCVITGYEPKNIRPDQRKVGNEHLQIATWIANIEANIQVLDNANNPIDSAMLKSHVEKDFVLAKKEDQAVDVTQKKTSWRDKLAGLTNTVRGGADLGDAAQTVGAGQKVHDALKKDEQLERPPTDLEWRDMVIESLAAKVANRIVPVQQDFTAILPLDKDFAEARDLAKAKHWGEVEEQMEKMPPLQGSNEAYRLYLLGLSNEALACGGSETAKEATEQLNKATKYYDDARKLRPTEHELFLAQLRAQDSLDHYLEIEHARESRAQTAASRPAPPPAKPAANVADNAALIGLVQAKMSEDVLIIYVQTAKAPRFDVSASGLIELSRASVPPKVIAAVQKRMLAAENQKATATRSHSAPPINE